jgi:hypothetical protein
MADPALPVEHGDANSASNGGRGIHPIPRFPPVANDAERLAKVFNTTDRFGIIAQLSGVLPGLYGLDQDLIHRLLVWLKPEDTPNNSFLKRVGNKFIGATPVIDALTTSEIDTSKRLAPNGAGGVTWGTGGGGGGGLTLTAVKTADYTAAVGELVQVDTTVGPSPITVLAPPAVGRALGDRFGVIVSKAAAAIDSSLIRDLSFDLNGGVPENNSFPNAAIRVSSFRAVWVVTSLTGGKSGDLPVWTNEDVNDYHLRSLIGRFDGSGVFTSDDTPTTLFSFDAAAFEPYRVRLYFSARRIVSTPGNFAQFALDAMFVNDAGISVEWFTFPVADVPPSLAGIVVDSVSVGTEVFLRVTGLPATGLAWSIEAGDVRILL